METSPAGERAKVGELRRPAPAAEDAEPPLCVDLDGTLVKSDTFMDSLALLGRRRPFHLLRFPFWALGGKARTKARVAALVEISPASLPYNRALLAFLERERAAGRKMYLATGADISQAQRIADYLGLFDGVLASDGAANLTGSRKLARMTERFPVFDYVGNGMPDLPVLKRARHAMVANPGLGLRGALRLRRVPVSSSFLDRANGLKAIAKAIRVHQWAKNVLVFLPLLLAHIFVLGVVETTAIAFLCFCFAASATYILNDLLDLDADRQHHTKRRRAFASGDLSVPAGVGIAAVLLAISLSCAVFLPGRFLVYLLAYLVATLAYSLYLKRIVIVDVMVLSGLYTLRVLAGAAATSILISPWLAAFGIFLFFSLAIVKRFSELHNLRDQGATSIKGRGYLLSDLEQLRSFGTASGYAAIVVFALYINGNGADLYRHPARMWLIVPLLIWWISRIWMLASRGLLDEDPVVFALTDWTSLLMGAAVAVIALAAL